MGGWVDGGCKSLFKDCLQQSKISNAVPLKVKFHEASALPSEQTSSGDRITSVAIFLQYTLYLGARQVCNNSKMLN